MKPATVKEQPIQVVSTAEALSSMTRQWKAEGLKIGLAPTMGALHEGHLSLVDIALEKADRVVVSVFVNPGQFAPHEDFDAYPREEEKDIAKLEARGVHLVYIPPVEEIYPDPDTVLDFIPQPGPSACGLEGDFRPGHFDSVVNVCHRLFKQAQPHIAVFGEKDFQQLQVIKESVADLDLKMEIVSAPVVRDEHGLALSSRNAYLSEEELQIARQLNKILRRPPDDTAQALIDAGFTKVDYIEQRWNRILAAAWIGKTRLIDNVEI